MRMVTGLCILCDRKKPFRFSVLESDVSSMRKQGSFASDETKLSHFKSFAFRVSFGSVSSRWGAGDQSREPK